jgi:inner membrane protein
MFPPKHGANTINYMSLYPLMPTIMTHAIIPVAAAMMLGKSRISTPVLAMGVIFAMLPDADVIGFKIGIAYEAVWGHRGATHSVAFAVFIAGVAVAMLRPENWRTVFWFLLIAAASHGLLDILTNGGLGAALLWPFSESRFHAPITPVRVSPIGAAFFSDRGVQVVLSELRWIWAPALALGFAGLFLRRRLDYLD